MGRFGVYPSGCSWFWRICVFLAYTQFPVCLIMFSSKRCGFVWRIRIPVSLSRDTVYTNPALDRGIESFS